MLIAWSCWNSSAWYSFGGWPITKTRPPPSVCVLMAVFQAAVVAAVITTGLWNCCRLGSVVQRCCPRCRSAGEVDSVWVVWWRCQHRVTDRLTKEQPRKHRCVKFPLDFVYKLHWFLQHSRSIADCVCVSKTLKHSVYVCLSAVSICHQWPITTMYILMVVYHSWAVKLPQFNWYRWIFTKFL